MTEDEFRRRIAAYIESGYDPVERIYTTLLVPLYSDRDKFRHFLGVLRSKVATDPSVRHAFREEFRTHFGLDI